MRSHWIEHEGEKILYCDYVGFSESDFDALKTELRDVENLLSNEPDHSVLSVSDVRDSVASRQAVEQFKLAAVRTGRHIRKQAVIGVTGIKKIFFDVIVRLSKQNAKAFDDLEQAKQWLVE